MEHFKEKQKWVGPKVVGVSEQFTILLHKKDLSVIHRLINIVRNLGFDMQAG
jgi:hypothetical protein